MADVQRWLDQPSSNHGWMLIGDDLGLQNAKRLLFSALTLAWTSRAAAQLQTWVIEHLTVQPGCEGADLAFLLASAMLFAPLPWRWRLLGLGVGAALVFVLNQARVVAPVLAAGRDRALFDLLHGTPLPLVVAVGAFFIGWLALAAVPRRQTA